MAKGKKQLTICCHCSKAKILWDMLLAIFGVTYVFPLTVKETLLSWHGSFVGKQCKKAWMALHFLDNMAGKKPACF